MGGQKIPSAGPEREALREKGQFWTPAWVAEAMVSYVLDDGCGEIFDPAVGAGAFFLAAKTIGAETGKQISLCGTEIDPSALSEARKNGLQEGDLLDVRLTDFILAPPKRRYPAIVANPPYIRHHRLSLAYKAKLREFGALLIGKPLDGRAGIHIYFLLRALQRLDRGGRLAFLMPADTCEGVFASPLWDWIGRNYRVEAVVTFAPQASPFPGVDTNPMIFMMRNVKPAQTFWWARCNRNATDALRKWVRSGFKGIPDDSLQVFRRNLAEGLMTGLSRAPMPHEASSLVLGNFATVMRGIATGANEFFFLTASQAAGLCIPKEFLVPAIGRTRDVTGEQITMATLHALEAKGRPTFLFAPDARKMEEFPPPVRKYLQSGKALGLHNRPLIRTRHPWYKMETRPVPPFLFAYLGRRNARFVRNFAGVLPLTGFLCVYPLKDDPNFAEKLWALLRHPQTVANLSLVAKSYGSGAIKVEPRALERLPVPPQVASSMGLEPPVESDQLVLPLAEAVG